jgi:hypothetical protein
MFELWNYLKSCIFGNKLKLVDELIEIIETEEKLTETKPVEESETPKPKKPRKKKTNVSDT